MSNITKKREEKDENDRHLTQKTFSSFMIDLVEELVPEILYRRNTGFYKQNALGSIRHLNYFTKTKFDEDKLKLIEDRQYHLKHPSIHENWWDGYFNEISEMSLDSYVSFVIESSGDFSNEIRFTEKTLRNF